MFKEVKVDDIVYRTIVLSPGYWSSDKRLFSVPIKVTKVLKNHFFCGDDKYTKTSGKCVGKDWSARLEGKNQLEAYRAYRAQILSSNHIQKRLENLRGLATWKLPQEDLDNLSSLLDNAYAQCKDE